MGKKKQKEIGILEAWTDGGLGDKAGHGFWSATKKACEPAVQPEGGASEAWLGVRLCFREITLAAGKQGRWLWEAQILTHRNSQNNPDEMTQVTNTADLTGPEKSEGLDFMDFFSLLFKVRTIS